MIISPGNHSFFTFAVQIKLD